MFAAREENEQATESAAIPSDCDCLPCHEGEGRKSERETLIWSNSPPPPCSRTAATPLPPRGLCRQPSHAMSWISHRLASSCRAEADAPLAPGRGRVAPPQIAATGSAPPGAAADGGRGCRKGGEATKRGVRWEARSRWMREATRCIGLARSNSFSVSLGWAKN